MGELKRVEPSFYIQHNPQSFSGTPSFKRVLQLENFIIAGGNNRISIYQAPQAKASEFTCPSLPINQLMHRDTNVMASKDYVEGAVLKMKGKSEGSQSLYGIIYYASNLLGIKPEALMALLYCENSELDEKQANRNARSILSFNKDRGLFQISDATRLSMNQPAFISEFLAAMDDGNKNYSRLYEMAKFFGVDAKGKQPYDVAAALIAKITEYRGSDKMPLQSKNKGNALVGTSKVHSLVYNTFAAAIYFTALVRKYENNYQLAAAAYKTGRTAVNNYLDPQPIERKKGEPISSFIRRRKESMRKAESRQQELADYSHKFWSYFAAFQAYHSNLRQMSFEDKVSFFYTAAIQPQYKELKAKSEP